MTASQKHWLVFLLLSAAIAGGYWYLARTFTAPLHILSIFNPRDTSAPVSVIQSEAVNLVRRTVEVPERFSSGAVGEYHTLSLPEGFTVSIFASGFEKARFLAVDPTTGDIFVSDASAGVVYRLADRDTNMIADENKSFFAGLTYPHGLAFHDGWLYIAAENQIVRVRDTDGDGDGDRREVIVPSLPSGGNHVSRTIVFDSTGMMYVSIGSTCNACDEEDPRRGAVVRYTADGKNETIFGEGLRNSVGLDFHPVTGQLWGSENGRDFLGDNLPPEEINIITEGKHYGWPDCYSRRVVDPDFGTEEFCATTEQPIVEMQAHSAPLGIRFIRGEDMPEYLRGDLLVAFHGSWNRREPTGYKVVRISEEDGQYRIRDFITGWQDGTKVWGRPVDMVEGSDGSLYVSDDELNVVYRIAYQGV